jgi:NTE family protein
MKARIGIALGSGVARGWGHIGVLRVLESEGIVPDLVCGTSIGALIGAVHLGGGTDALEHWALKLTKARMSRLFDFDFGQGGIIAGRRILRIFHPSLLETSIDELARPFVAVATDLNTGHEVWLSEGSVIDAVRASYAIPGLFPPVARDGRWLVDGALVNPVPVSVCRAMSAELTIAVNLNADVFGPAPAGEDALDLEQRDVAESGAGPGFIRGYFRRRNGTPSTFGVLARSLHIVQDRISRARLAGDPPDVTIAPRLGHVGYLEFHRAAECIAAGEEATRLALPRIREAMRRLDNGAAAWNRHARGRSADGAGIGGPAPRGGSRAAQP